MDTETQQNSGALAQASAQDIDQYDDDDYRAPGCTCNAPSEYNNEDNVSIHRHEEECALAPNLEGWLWYPHDGEIENGGVWVNPSDTSVIYLEVRGYLCRTPHGTKECLFICPTCQTHVWSQLVEYGIYTVWCDCTTMMGADKVPQGPEEWGEAR